MSSMAAILNLFFASSPESKGLLTLNLIGSIGVTCRSKIVQIVMAAILFYIYLYRENISKSFCLKPEGPGSSMRNAGFGAPTKTDPKFSPKPFAQIKAAPVTF